MTKVLPQIVIHPVVLKLTPAINLTDDQLFELCQLNQDWRIEYTAQGELIVMPRTGGKRAARMQRSLSKYNRGHEVIRPVLRSTRPPASSFPTAPPALLMPPGSDARV